MRSSKSLLSHSFDTHAPLVCEENKNLVVIADARVSEEAHV